MTRVFGLADGGGLGGDWLFDEFADESGHLLDEGGVGGWVGGARETGMNLADATVTGYEKARRPAVKVVGLGHLLVELLGGSSKQDGVIKMVAGNKRAEACGALEFFRVVFEVQIDDLQAAGMELLVETLQDRGLIVAIGAPGASYRYDHDFPVELRVCVGNGFSG